MKRILPVVLLLAACGPRVSGVTCQSDTDCQGGSTCSTGVCVEKSCDPACGPAFDCRGGKCAPGFEKLALTAPTTGAQSAEANVKVAATLTRRPDSKATFPASVSLSGTAKDGTPEETTLAGAGDGTYAGAFTPKRAGEYQLVAKSPEAGLASEAVTVTFACPSACKAYEECLAAVCRPAFEKLAITIPAAAAEVKATFQVEVQLTKHEGSTAAAPATVKLLVAPVAGTAVETTLALVAGTTTYKGTVTATTGGAHTLTAVAADLGALTSAAVGVVVTDCPQLCGANTECVKGGCLKSYSAIAITQPAASATVGKSVKVKAKLTKNSGATGAAPASVTLTATPKTAGKPAELVTLSTDATVTDGFTGTWAPVESGGYDLVVGSTTLALTSSTVTVSVDAAGPTFVVSVVAPVRKPHEIDAAALNALRRDETATVLVFSTDADVDLASVAVAVKGTSGTGVTKSVVTSTKCTGTGFCAEAAVDLWDPALGMKSFRADFQAKASGSDLVGNAGTSGTAIFGVTRWKWAFASGGALKSAPAVGTKGDLFIGDSALKKVYAIGNDGLKKWEFLTDGAVDSSIAVGDVGGKESIFVGGISAGKGAIWTLDSTVATPSQNYPTTVPLCTGGDSLKGSIALMKTKISGEPTAITTVAAAFNLANGAQLVAARQGGTVPCAASLIAGLGSGVGGVTGFATSGVEAFFGDDDGNLQNYSFDSVSANWKAKPAGWPVLIGSGVAPSNPIITGAGIAGGGGVGVGRVFLVPLAGGTATTLNTGSPTWNASQTTSKSIVAGSSNGVLQLANETLTTSNTTNLGGGAIVGAPAVGSDKVIYVSTRGKKLFALDTAPGTPETATKLWEVDLGASSDSSPALDCSRDASGAAIPGRPGVLYVGADDGKLYAFITDSRGLDTTAPWPKFHRDPRNSADATVDLNTFKCP